MKRRPKCVHCLRKPANRPRQLCWPCYYRPGVRDMYPFKAHRGSARGVSAGENPAGRPLPPSPTAAGVGSEAKIAVLAERARLGFSLWHPADATDSGAAIEGGGEKWRPTMGRVRVVKMPRG